MKLLTSPSISASSDVSFDPKMCTSKSATAGCLAGILRRILCSRSLPTHPSDHTTEASSMAFDKQKELDQNALNKVEAKVSPGIVGRLMGLDSLPEISMLNCDVRPNSISRSRSMNSVDYTHRQGTAEQMQGKHRRVSTTLSFRDMPTFLENEEFLILSFEKEDESRKLRSKGRKCKAGSGEPKQTKRDKRKEEENRVLEKVSDGKEKESHQQSCKKALSVLIQEELVWRTTGKHNQDVAKCGKIEDWSTNISLSFKGSCEKSIPSIKALESSKFLERMEVFDEAKSRKKKKKLHRSLAQDVGPECSSEDSSPVSVLDFDQFVIDQEASTSDEDSKLQDLRRKLTLKHEYYGCQSPHDDDTLVENDRRIKTRESKSLESRKNGCHSRKDYMDLWDAICSMIEGEVNQSNWIISTMFTHEDVDDITADLGLQILDQLLDEAVVQLFGLPMNNLKV